MMHSDQNKSWTIGISSVFIVVCLLYWLDFGAAGSIKDLKAAVDKQLNSCTKAKSYSKYAEANNQTRNDVNTNRYADSQLKKVYNAFFQQWKTNDTVSGKDAKTFKGNIGTAFSDVKSSNNNLNTNQAISVGVIALILILFFVLARHENLLRDIVGNWNNINQANLVRLSESLSPDIEPPYSLARTQLAIWTAIIGCVYIYAILWDQRDIQSINQTALILMGISAGTFAAGTVIDVTEINQGVRRGQDQPSEGFFRDILSDKTGNISIQRFQNVVWTFIAIIIYIYRYNNPTDIHQLPELDGTLLALTGISSATYLVFKARENMIPGKEITIQLTPGDTLTDAEKKFISDSSEGLSKATVKLMSADNTNVIPATPVSGSKSDFTARQFNEQVHKKITAEWKGKVQSDGEEIVLKCTNNNLSYKEGETVIIKLDK